MLPPQFVSLLITLLQRIEQFSEQDQTKAMVSHILGPVPLRGRGYMAGRTNMAKNETLDVNGARIRKYGTSRETTLDHCRIGCLGVLNRAMHTTLLANIIRSRCCLCRESQSTQLL